MELVTSEKSMVALILLGRWVHIPNERMYPQSLFILNNLTNHLLRVYNTCLCLLPSVSVVRTGFVIRH